MSYELHPGSHDPGDDRKCAMEWVSYLAGEPHTDTPQCVSPVLRGTFMSLNDSLEHATRQRLRPFLARCIGTSKDGMDEERRRLIAAWLEQLPDMPQLARDGGCTPFGMWVARTVFALRSDSAQKAALKAAKKVTWEQYMSTGVWTDPGYMSLGEHRGGLWGDTVAEVQRKLPHANGRTAGYTPDSVFTLLNELLPTEVIQIPVAADWRELVAA